MKSVLLELYNKGKQFNVVLTTTVEFKVNKLLDYKTHAQKFVLTIFIMSSSQALVSGIFFYLDTIYTTRYVTVHL